MFYVMKPGYGFGSPSEKYLRTIREGYENWKAQESQLISMAKQNIYLGVISTQTVKKALKETNAV